MVGASEEIRRTVVTWNNVTVHPHRFGGIEFRFGRRELGHLHGDSLLDVPFPLSVKEELLAAGKAQEHHVLPESGWISFRIRTSDDVAYAVELLHKSLEIALKSKLNKAAFNRITTTREQQE